VTRWTCPQCEREFARTKQTHVCVPGITIDDCFSGHPPGQRAAYDAVATHVTTLGEVHEDAVGVGVFLKRARTLAELRPKSRWLSLDVVLPRLVEDGRVSRHLRLAGDRTVHVVRLFGPDDVDDQVRDWLTEAWHAAG
jgi:hypothetical protein